MGWVFSVSGCSHPLCFLHYRPPTPLSHKEQIFSKVPGVTVSFESVTCTVCFKHPHNLGDATMMSQQGHPAWIWTCVPCTNRNDGESGGPSRTSDLGCFHGGLGDGCAGLGLTWLQSVLNRAQTHIQAGLGTRNLHPGFCVVFGSVEGRYLLAVNGGHRSCVLVLAASAGAKAHMPSSDAGESLVCSMRNARPTHCLRALDPIWMQRDL